MRWASRSRLLLLVRGLLLLAAALAAVAGFALLKEDSGNTGGVVYGCPMHPDVRATKAGDCPICRMALEPVKGAAAVPHSHDEHAHSPNEAKPGAEVPHEPVPEGSFSIPKSPVFGAFDAVSRVMIRPISLEMRGPASVDRDDGGVALFFLDEGELLKPGEEGAFSPSADSPHVAAPPVAVRTATEPPARWDARTVLVRFTFVDAELPLGSTGSVKFATRLRHGLTVKAGAVLRSPEGTEVFVVSSDRRTFTRRKVEIGNVIYGLAAVISGLSPGEQVAAKHTLALDAEWRSRQDVSL